MTDASILRREKIAAKLKEITEKAVKDGAIPAEIFAALECVFSFWLGHLVESDREAAIRTLEQDLPHMLQAAKRFAAVAKYGDLQ